MKWCTETQHLVRYEHLNSHGTVFGGTMAAWIDEATAIYAMKTMGTKRIVTIKIGELVFKKPVQLSDLVEFSCATLKSGKTSLTVKVKVQKTGEDSQKQDVVEAEVTFVSIDDKGHSFPWC